jgi:hypothetical protein
VYKYQSNGKVPSPLLAIWLDGQNATNSFDTQKITINFSDTKFQEPVWVDLMTGKVYEIADDQWEQNGEKVEFEIPVYDSPVLIAEKSSLNLL